MNQIYNFDRKESTKEISQMNLKIIDKRKHIRFENQKLFCTSKLFNAHI